MYWDRFHICEAYFCFAQHAAFSDRDYDAIMERLERLSFKPRPSLVEAPKNLSENGKHIYMGIVRSYFDTQRTL